MDLSGADFNGDRRSPPNANHGAYLVCEFRNEDRWSFYAPAATPLPVLRTAGVAANAAAKNTRVDAGTKEKEMRIQSCAYLTCSCFGFAGNRLCRGEEDGRLRY